MVPIFKNAGERSSAKSHSPAGLLSVVTKVFEKLGNNRILDHVEKYGLFSEFHYGFRFSRSPFNRSGATQAVALVKSKAFDKVWHAGLLHKLKSYGISGQIFGLFLLF